VHFDLRKPKNSVPSRLAAGRGALRGLPRALDETGRLSVVRLGWLKCRTAVLGPDSSPTE